MAKQIPDLTSIVASELSVDDLLVIRDVSAQKDKKVRIGDIVGMPTLGWVSTVDTWVFTSCEDGILEVGVSGKPKEKYANNMRVQFTHEDKTKYGIVQEVKNNGLKIRMLDGEDITNSVIKTPQYSTEYTPATKDNVDFTAIKEQPFVIKEKVKLGVLLATFTRWGNMVMVQFITTAGMPIVQTQVQEKIPEGFRPYAPKGKQTEVQITLAGWNNNRLNGIASAKLYSTGVMTYLANDSFNEWYGTGIWRTEDPFPTA